MGPIIVKLRFFLNDRTNLVLLLPPLRSCVQKNDLDDFKVYLKSLNAKLCHLEVNISNSKNSQRNVSKLKRELKNVRGSKDFKKAGNEIQCLFNQELEGKIEGY